jgi:hypothetical protein
MLPTDWDLRDLPARAIAFLHAVAQEPAIQVALSPGGYNNTTQAEGLALVVQACQLRSDGSLERADRVAKSAERELTAWISRHHRRLRLALEREAPAAVLWLPNQSFHSSEGPELVAQLLYQLSKARKSAQDLDGVRVLEQRGLTADMERHLAELVEQARLTVDTTGSTAAKTSAKDPMVALHRWLRDWSATAQVFIRRKDWLRRLGVIRARRKA